MNKYNKNNLKEKIIKYAKNLLIELSDKEINILVLELDELFESLHDFYNINVDDINPTYFPFSNINKLREDKHENSKNIDDILSCSSNWNGKYIKVK